VIRIPPALTANARRSAREPGKSDRIDALAVAHTAVKEGLERFPAAFLDEQATAVRLLCDYRHQLVAERTRAINTLRWHLLALDPELEASLRPSGLQGPRIRAKVARRLARDGDGAQAKIAQGLLRRINEITRQELDLRAQMNALIAAHAPQVLLPREATTMRGSRTCWSSCARAIAPRPGCAFGLGQAGFGDRTIVCCNLVLWQ
jgi:transposase